MAITVDTLVDWETATDGTEITDAVMVAATKGSTFQGWETTNNPSAQTTGPTPYLTIENDAAHAIYTPWIVGGTTYSSAGTRGMRAVMSANNAVQLDLSSASPACSIGFYFRFTGAGINDSPRDLVAMYDQLGGFQVLQIYDSSSGDPYFHAHWQPNSGVNTGNNVTFFRNHWYWVTTKWALGGQNTEIKFYDAEAGYNLVGTSIGAVTGSSTTGCKMIQVGCVQYFAGGTQWVDYDNFVIDTTGVFPLGPGAGPENSINLTTLNATTFTVG